MARNSESGKFEISGAGVLLLAVATLLASAIVFLLGVYVGKGMVEARMSQEARVVRLPVPAGNAPAKNGEVDVTFWDKLGKGESGAPAPAAAASPTAAETPVRVVPEAPTARATVPAAQPTSPPARPPAPTHAPAPAASSGGAYQVQVNAMSERARADQLILDLKGLGYSAYISPARLGEKTLYRVRVSGLESEATAKQAVGRLRESGYPNAFLVNEGGAR